MKPVTPILRNPNFLWEQIGNADAQAGHAGAFQRVLQPNYDLLLVASLLGLAIDFDLPFPAQHDPVLLHASFGVEERDFAVQRDTGKSHLDNQFRRRRMSGGEIGVAAAHNRNVRLRLRIYESERLVFPDRIAGWQLEREQFVEKRTDRAMQRL